MDRIRVDLNGPPQTMLATLYAKALDADAPNSILNDHYAKAAVERIDYDWDATTIDARTAPSIAIRSAHFDNWARQFLAVHDERQPVCQGDLQLRVPGPRRRLPLAVPGPLRRRIPRR